MGETVTYFVTFLMLNIYTDMYKTVKTQEPSTSSLFGKLTTTAKEYKINLPKNGLIQSKLSLSKKKSTTNRLRKEQSKSN